MTDFNPYEVLGAAEEATTEGIRALYRMRAKTDHPDAGGLREQWDRLTLAHDILTDPDRRAFYDQTGRIDAPDPAKERQEAYTLIADSLMQFTNEYMQSNRAASRDPRRQGVLDRIGSMMRREISDATRALGQGREHLEFMRDYAGRLQRAESAQGVDHVAAIMRQKIAAIEGQIFQLEGALRVRELAIKLLAEYSFEHIEDESLFTTTSSSIWTGA